MSRYTFQYFMLLTLASWVTSASHAQQQTAPSAATSAPSALSSSLGVYVFPAKQQTAQQQTTDEAACFDWAKGQTGIDPKAIKPQAPDQQSAEKAADTATQGARLRGAARGAAAGAVIGGVAGDAGTGAAAGAAAGTLAGGATKRQAKRQAAAGAEQQAQASVEQQKVAYNKAFSACMEGKGYTIK
jgi:hypothetical protein